MINCHACSNKGYIRVLEHESENVDYYLCNCVNMRPTFLEDFKKREGFEPSKIDQNGRIIVNE